MIQILRKLRTRYAPPESFRSHVLTLMTGTTIAQAIPIVASPIITRLYVPKDFGVFAEFLAIVSILSTISTLRYDYAITISKSTLEAKHLAVLSLASLCTFLILAIPFYCLSGHVYLIKYKSLSNRFVVCSIAVGVILTVAYNIFYNYGLSRGAVHRISVVRVLNSTINAASSIVLSFFTNVGMIFSYLLGYCVGVFVLRFREGAEDTCKNKVRYSELKSTAKKYMDFPLYMTAHSLLNSLIFNLPVLFLGYYYSSQESGYFSIALRLFIPFDILSLAVSQTLLPKMTKMDSPEELYSFSKRLFFKLLWCTAPAVLLVVLFGQSIFTTVFGVRYSMSGIYFQIMSPMLYVRFFGSIFSNILIITRRQKFGLMMEILNFGVVMTVFGLFNRSCYETLILFSLSSLSVSLFKLWFYFRSAKALAHA